MLICIITIAIPVLLALLWVVFKIGDICYDKIYDEYYQLNWNSAISKKDPRLIKAKKKLDKLNWTRNDCREIFGTASLICLLLPFFSFLILLCMRNNFVDKRDYEKFIHEKDVLEYRLESGVEIGNELLYNDIVEFNNKLTDYKYGRENIWVSWYFNPKIAEIPYIEYKNNNDNSDVPEKASEINM